MKTLAYISVLSILLPAVMAFSRWTFARPHLRVIIIYFGACLITEAVASWMGYHKMNNNLVANLFYITEGLLLITFFYLFYKEKEFLIPAVILAMVYVIYGSYTSFIDPGYTRYNANFRAAESLMIQALSAYALIKISREEELNLVRRPEFWISSAFFVYFSVNVAVFFTATFLFDNQSSMMRKTWVIHSIVNIGANIIFTFGLSCIPRSLRRLHPE